MESVEIDQDVFEYLQGHAQPFIDTPNSTLRRLLGIDPAIAASTQQKSPILISPALEERAVEKYEVSTSAPLGDLSPPPLKKFTMQKYLDTNRSKAPKADLRLLVQEGVLHNGQKLYLVDYQGKRVQNFFAVISPTGLIYRGKGYSMSHLAQELLIQVGFKSNSVRGPSHWVTDEGRSIKDIWQEYLDESLSRV